MNSIKIIDTEVYTWHQCSQGSGIPIVIVPPHAGRDWTIAFNMIEECMKTGRPVYAFELKSATQATKETSVSDLVGAIDAIMEFISEPIDLIGLCQGGWVSSIYTALNPGHVRKLAIFVAPINTKCAKDNLIEKHMAKPFVVEIQELIVAANFGIQPGILQWLAFSFVDPMETYYKRFQRLNELRAAGDEEGIAKWEYQNKWYDNKLDLAGVWFLDAYKNLFRDNRLYEGTWRVQDSLVDLGNITGDVYAFGGKTDSITDSRQCLSIGDKVSGRFFGTELDGGHTWGFTSKKGLAVFAKMFLY